MKHGEWHVEQGMSSMYLRQRQVILWKTTIMAKLSYESKLYWVVRVERLILLDDDDFNIDETQALEWL